MNTSGVSITALRTRHMKGILQNYVDAIRVGTPSNPGQEVLFSETFLARSLAEELSGKFNIGVVQLHGNQSSPLSGNTPPYVAIYDRLEDQSITHILR